MKKTLLLALLLAIPNISPLWAVQVTSQEEDDEALKRGRNAKNVCFISSFFKTDKSSEQIHFLGGGTAALIEPDILITAGHVIYGNLLDLLKKEETKVEAEKIVDELKAGNPTPFSGFLTFVPNVHKAMTFYENSQDDAYLSRTFFEIDSVIVHPSYNFVETDLAFIKLKKPVEGITPLFLYQEGAINPLGRHKENDTDLSTLIKARFSGYGADITDRWGKKRTVSHLCFLNDYSDADSSSEESDSEENGNEQVRISAYIPSTQEVSTVELEEKKRNFHDALDQQKQESEIYGFVHYGDSGGPLIVTNNDGKEFVVGLASRSGVGDYYIQDEIETFYEVRAYARLYKSSFCPLFTLEGKLRPAIPMMINKLKAFSIT